MKSCSLFSDSSNLCSRLNPLFYGFVMGLGIGLATRNAAVGVAVGVVFAAFWTVKNRKA